jgi:hypothetical protein
MFPGAFHQGNLHVLLHPSLAARQTLAPCMPAGLTGRPDRLLYPSRGLHHPGAGSLRDIDWISRSRNAAQAYSETKLHVTALALTLARTWPEVLSNAVDPGWVPAKMGGPAAAGGLQTGYLTQTWLAVSSDAAPTVSGGYQYRRQRQAPAPQARDPAFQDQLMDRLAALTGVALFERRGRVQPDPGRAPGPGVPGRRPPRCVTPGYARPRPQRSHAREPRRSKASSRGCAEAQVALRDRLSCQPPSPASWVCDCRPTIRAWPSLALDPSALDPVRGVRGRRSRPAQSARSPCPRFTGTR